LAANQSRRPDQSGFAAPTHDETHPSGRDVRAQRGGDLLIEPERTSPMVNTPRALVSHGRLVWSEPLPVNTKPFWSIATPEPLGQSVFGSAPMNRKRWRTGYRVSLPDARQRTASERDSAPFEAADVCLET
jgi:hypothetical protein